MRGLEALHQLAEAFLLLTEQGGDVREAVLLLGRQLGAARRDPERGRCAVLKQPGPGMPKCSLDEETPELPPALAVERG